MSGGERGKNPLYAVTWFYWFANKTENGSNTAYKCSSSDVKIVEHSCNTHIQIAGYDTVSPDETFR
jgi:hypothetical protein